MEQGWNKCFLSFQNAFAYICKKRYATNAVNDNKNKNKKKKDNKNKKEIFRSFQHVENPQIVENPVENCHLYVENLKTDVENCSFYVF